MKSVLGADPFILFDKNSGFYYSYCTGGDEKGAFRIYKSKDMVEWEFVSLALSFSHPNVWGKDWFWAPECYYNDNNGYYYLFYSARVKDELTKEYFAIDDYFESAKIGVAVSKSPEGPFVNITNRPLDYYPYDPEYYDIDAICDNVFDKNKDDNLEKNAPKGVYLSSIDADIFIDDDKRIYLYFSRCCYRNCVYDEKLDKYIEESNICVVELNNDWWFTKGEPIMPTIKSDYKVIAENGLRQDKFLTVINYNNEPQEWENGHINDYEMFNLKNRRWSEGSALFKHKIDDKDMYFIMYSCNNFQNSLYGVGIAYSDNPISGFKKFDGNPIISQNEKESLYSTGHGSFLKVNNEYYYLFHGRDNPKHNRIVYLGKVIVNNLKDIFVHDIKKCVLK